MTDNTEKTKNEDQDLFEHYRFEVDKGQSPLRIDKYLTMRIENASRSKIQAAAEAECILVNGKPVKSNYKVKPNDTISIVMSEPPREIEIIPENIPIEIVYEDEDLVVVNKPAGMVVHPAYGHYTGTLVNALAYHIKDSELFAEKDIRPGLVHRIDKNTSGLLVVAKKEIAKNKLAKQFFDHTIDRKYWALVWGHIDPENGTIQGNIGRNPKDRKVMYVFKNGESGKHAVTHYKTIEKFDYVSLIECKLETGRTHQIRVHTQYIGHPIFNDAEYGGDVIRKGTTFTKYKQFVRNCMDLLPGQALHAKTLGFVHPTTGKEMYFEAPLPDYFEEVLDRWRKYISNR